MNTLRDPTRKPTYPGETLREDVLTAHNMTQVEFANRLSVGRLTLSALLLEKRGVSADMSMCVSKLTNTTPESWLRMQYALDLWLLEREPKRDRNIEPIAA